MVKTTPSPLVVSLLLVLGIVAASAQEADASLQVINGDFSDMDGMTALPQPGWYSGVPAGWSAAPPPTAQDGFFALRAGDGMYFANLHVLSRIKPEFQPFEQDVGVLTEISDVTLTFENIAFKDEEFSMGAAIADSDGRGPAAILARQNFKQSGGQSVVAKNVPAGTRIAIRFWGVKGFPGIGNVTIEVAPTP
jgi:hypothetical protein